MLENILGERIGTRDEESVSKLCRLPSRSGRKFFGQGSALKGTVDFYFHQEKFWNSFFQAQFLQEPHI